MGGSAGSGPSPGQRPAGAFVEYVYQLNATGVVTDVIPFDDRGNAFAFGAFASPVAIAGNPANPNQRLMSNGVTDGFILFVSSLARLVAWK